VGESGACGQSKLDLRELHGKILGRLGDPLLYGRGEEGYTRDLAGSVYLACEMSRRILMESKTRKVAGSS